MVLYVHTQLVSLEPVGYLSHGNYAVALWSQYLAIGRYGLVKLHVQWNPFYS